MASKLSKKSAIDKLIAVHGNTYDYSSTTYRGFRLSISVCCRVHGNFRVEYSAHRIGKGCPKCKHPRPKISSTKPVKKRPQKQNHHRKVFEYNGWSKWVD